MKETQTKIPYEAAVHDEEHVFVHFPRHDHVWTSAEHDGWHVRSEWRPMGGRVEPYRVEIQRVDDAPIGAGAIRRLPLGEMLAASRQALVARAQTEVESGRERWVDWESLAERGPKRGKALTDADLQAVAAVYREAWDSGQHVTAAVAKAACISKSTAAKRIMLARAAGLLDGVGPQR